MNGILKNPSDTQILTLILILLRGTTFNVQRLQILILIIYLLRTLLRRNDGISKIVCGYLVL